MLDRDSLHADLIAYCDRIGAAPTTFGQSLFGDTGFAERLRRGVAPIGKVALAQCFMAEHPDVPRRQFGAVAKVWRDRIKAEGGGAGRGDHRGEPGAAAIGNGACMFGTLDQSNALHNQESQSQGATLLPEVAE